MSVIVAPNDNKVTYIGSTVNHPLTANLGEMMVCQGCGVICFTEQTGFVAGAFDLRSQKRVCLACQTTGATANFEVEIIH